MKQIKNTIMTLGLFTVMLMAGKAEGELIEFTFGGNLEFMTVTGPPTGPWADIGVGDPFSVVYVFNSEAVDQDSDISIGLYTMQSLSVTIAGITLEAGFAELTIDTLFQPFNEYSVLFADFPFPAGGTIVLSTWFLLDSDELLTDINLDDWFVSNLFSMGTEFSEFSGEPTTFSSRIVPAPGGMFLPVLSLIIFNGRRRRKTTS